MSKAQQIVDNMPGQSKLAVFRLLAKEFAEKQSARLKNVEEGSWVKVSKADGTEEIGQVCHILSYGFDMLTTDQTMVTISLSCKFKPCDPPNTSEKTKPAQCEDKVPQVFLEGSWVDTEIKARTARLVTCVYKGRIISVTADKVRYGN